MNKQQAIEFILKTGQPTAYIQEDNYYRFQNIGFTDKETLYTYKSENKSMTIKVPKELKGKISVYDNIRKDIYGRIITENA